MHFALQELHQLELCQIQQEINAGSHSSSASMSHTLSESSPPLTVLACHRHCQKATPQYFEPCIQFYRNPQLNTENGQSKLVQTGADWSRLTQAGQAGPGWSRLVQAGPDCSRLVHVGPGWSKDNSNRERMQGSD